MERLTEMLGSRYPIIQGPIGAMNSPRLVAAISEAGGFGMLALGFITDTDEVKRLIDEVKALTGKPFGANIVMTNAANQRILELLAAAGVKTVTTSVGNPTQIYPIIHDLGMKGLHVLLALRHAMRAEDAGVDGLVVAGAEAGGLRSPGSESTTMVLVPLVADHVSIPVVAAGGIADSRGFRAALALGAEGVQVGTRFLASQESIAPEAWKRAIVEAQDGGTDLLSLGNMRVRVIMTPWLGERMKDPDFRVDKEVNMMDLVRPGGEVDYTKFPAGAGQIAALIREILPASEIIREMVS